MLENLCLSEWFCNLEMALKNDTDFLSHACVIFEVNIWPLSLASDILHVFHLLACGN